MRKKGCFSLNKPLHPALALWSSILANFTFHEYFWEFWLYESWIMVRLTTSFGRGTVHHSRGVLYITPLERRLCSAWSIQLFAREYCRNGRKKLVCFPVDTVGKLFKQMLRTKEASKSNLPEEWVILKLVSQFNWRTSFIYFHLYEKIFFLNTNLSPWELWLLFV